MAKLRTDFTGKYAVGISTNIGDNSLYVFAIDPTAGTLTPVIGSPFATTAAQLSDLRVHPSSQFVYSFGSDSNGNFTSVEGFSLNASTATSAASECVFSIGGDIVTKKRNRLGASNTRRLLCLQD